MKKKKKKTSNQARRKVAPSAFSASLTPNLPPSMCPTSPLGSLRPSPPTPPSSDLSSPSTLISSSRLSFMLSLPSTTTPSHDMSSISCPLSVIPPEPHTADFVARVSDRLSFGALAW
ncbi:Hypothetical predicted protein, partial [Prunus dulcis]